MKKSKNGNSLNNVCVYMCMCMCKGSVTESSVLIDPSNLKHFVVFLSSNIR